MFWYEVYLRMYLPLTLKMYNRLFIDSLGITVVERIKKHVLGLTYIVRNTHLGPHFG